MSAGGAYRRAGVVIDWFFAANGYVSASPLTIVIVPAASSAGFRVVEDSMGVARSVDGDRRDTAYVFHDRVRASCVVLPVIP